MRKIYCTSSDVPNISVIMPVYNAQEYVDSAIREITIQSFINFELLIIDDGSTDDTATILNNWKAKDSRIKVLTKKNGGVASARQLGVEHSVGSYIIHTDADDILLPDALYILYEKARQTNADIVVGDYLQGTESVFQKKTHCGIKSSEDLLNAALNGRVHAALWNKLIRRDMYKNLYFEDGLDFMEDFLLLTKILIFKNPIIQFINEPVYFYITRQKSYTNSISEKYLQKGLKVVRKINELLGADNVYTKGLINFNLNHLLLWVLNSKLSAREIKILLPTKLTQLKLTTFPLKYMILLYSVNLGIDAPKNIYNFFRKRL